MRFYPIANYLPERFQGFSTNVAQHCSGSHFYTWVERGTERARTQQNNPDCLIKLQATSSKIWTLSCLNKGYDDDDDGDDDDDDDDAAADDDDNDEENSIALNIRPPRLSEYTNVI